MSLLAIEDLTATIGGKKVLNGLSLTIEPGEIHAILGPNGAGKSSLGHVLAGRPGYTVSARRLEFDGQDLLSMPTEERARAGLFLSFQYPVEIPGVTNSAFLRAAINAKRAHRGEAEIDGATYLKLLKEKIALVGLDKGFLNRGVNEGFSGGEKKRNEILQLAVLEPRLAILDETDSGLDVDALRVVGETLKSLRHRDRSMLVVTHYDRLLELLEPDAVHILVDGTIVESGDRSLASVLGGRGFADFGGGRDGQELEANA